MESTLEVLTTRKSGREVHRDWPDEDKAPIFSESLRLGALVNEVAERHEAEPPFHLADDGASAEAGVACIPDAVEFAAVIVDSPISEPPIKKASRPEIIVVSVTIRSDHRGDQAFRFPQGP